tara:strand:+ start:155 stop:655 length:501 start_codon:yes stop_codon:yes gene_type:complete
MRISKNFTLSELTSSNTAKRLGINNTPDKEGIFKLRILVTTLLQPIRDRIGVPIRVSSGYRSLELNRTITGRSDYISQHSKCEAVDLKCVVRGKMDNLRIYNTLIEGGFDFDQCILEFGGATETTESKCPNWIHLSYSMDNNRRQVLVAYKDKNNRTKYRKPINKI